MPPQSLLQRALPSSVASSQLGVRYLGALLGVGLAYLFAARFGLSLAFATRQVTAVWPPTGIAIAALVLFGHRVWPALFVGAMAANLGASESILTAFGIAVGNTLGPLAGVWLLRRWGQFEPTIERVRDVFSLVFWAALLGMTITASNGVLQLALAGIVPWQSYGSVWWVWWVGDAMGVILFAPLILSFAARSPLELGARRWLELGVLFGLLFSVGSIAFSSGVFREAANNYHLQYAVFPFVMWAALRFGPREASSAVALVSGLAIWATIHDRGPFGAGALGLDERLVLLETFMFILSLTGLTLAALTAERTRAERALRGANDELEVRVQERTRELFDANAELAKKNEEVEAFVYIVSHDLRGPLVNIHGFSKEIELSMDELDGELRSAELPHPQKTNIERILSQDVAEALRYIAASVTKFQRLTDALLVLSRHGRQDYRKDPVDVGAVVAVTLDSLRQLVERSGASVSVQPLPWAVGDVTAIGQIFTNLIGNALKYLSAERSGQIEVGGNVVDLFGHYFVRDNGSGIPRSAERRLFQVFQRFHPELAAGEGMGLAIVKRAVERQGGKIWFETEEGRGTTFYLSLPLADARKVEAHDADAPAANPAAR